MEAKHISRLTRIAVSEQQGTTVAAYKDNKKNIYIEVYNKTEDREELAYGPFNQIALNALSTVVGDLIWMKGMYAPV